ncbi:hypothetical protein EN794_039375 [Mesorhizobium sp. M00.F.Ca.ET.151.01.1.1]|nr:hypothetical protein EN842_33785 [bacterium M00.F.Ca.ET.199.01.1.1]TGT02982.1 hypothetical protein EN820_22195 [bacterium M00.F.Ca.ET.177.01.1.1]TGT57918.1 hypothetical protein EN813_035265 [Mesorhizobium sp. M00.F.Ca.ET.170.01.1.1]TGU06831.1 hypothetical protein EN806_33055 [bacterium M00.F.Ca.ET.163.01.1.1]TGU91532.1 hypothetical protein EN794_039375 [Mesorhizobium sp. M00.F.Ca.ET.151.01.1.1]TGV53220.1 hypothetical protein EN784_40900 [bacterium M00.F.Ca.ET.141.01.1.1]
MPVSCRHASALPGPAFSVGIVAGEPNAAARRCCLCFDGYSSARCPAALWRVHDIKSDSPDHGFQPSNQFELSAKGPATHGLEHQLPELLLAVGIDVLN